MAAHRSTKPYGLLVVAGIGAAGVLAILLNRKSAPIAPGARGRLLAEIKNWFPSEMGSNGRFEQLLGPSTGDKKWAYYEINAKTGKGFGTTCAVVAAALLARVGCNPALINRNPPDGTGFTIGAHISKLVAGAQQIGAWRAGSTLAGIKPGDIYLIATPPKGTDGHVGFFLSRNGDWVETADAGQSSADGQQAARFVKRLFKDGALSGPDGAPPFRPVQGYVDVDAACASAKAAPQGKAAA